MIQQQPWCIYCGQTTYGNTVDHMPPINIFDFRRRPQGMEFLACADCNSNSKGDDQVAGLISRLGPSDLGSGRIKEVEAIMTSTHNNHPGLLEEMQPNFRQRREGRQTYGNNLKVFNASGPILTKIMNRFAAKQGLALYFHATKRTLPATGGVAVRWFSNDDLVTGVFPRDIWNIMGRPDTLRQGKIEVSDQFGYSFSIADNQKMAAHLAWFRKSFSILAFVAEDIDRLKEAPDNNVFRPGFLKKKD